MLDCQSLNIIYGKKIRALCDFSITVRQGEIVALIGANGAGKSSFLKALSGLIRLESGIILFNGTPIQNLPAHTISSFGIAHVPEGRRIFSWLTVLENLQLGAFLKPKEIRQKMDELFELFPVLKERMSQLGGTLSGGEQQMLAMARALISDPELLLLDEPSMGLAPVLVEKIFQTIQRINHQGTTILLVEQNAHQSLSLAHRGYVLETGRVVLEGTGKELLHNELIQHAYLGAR